MGTWPPLQAKQASVKKVKKAVRIGNIDYMPNEELIEELKKRKLSDKGSKDVLKKRLAEAYDNEANEMRSATRVANHFISATTKRNIEMLVAKVYCCMCYVYTCPR
jgi:hypothetical protein